MSDYTENSPICRRIPLTVNSRMLRFVYPDRPSELIWNQEDLPHFCLGETVIFCFTFLDDSLRPVTFQEDDLFELAADADFIHGDDPLMLFAGPESVNLEGDWLEADPTQGKISIRVNCNTVGFEQKIGTAEKLVIRMEVRRFVGGIQTVLLGDKTVARNSVHTNENSPEDAGPEYYSAFQIDQIIDEIENENDAVHETLEQGIEKVVNAAATAQSTADEAKTNAATAQSTADEAKTNAATAQSTADEAVTAAATAQSTADEAVTAAATAQSTADEAKTNAATAQSTADSKITAPTTTGTAGQVLTLDSDAVTPVWADPSGGGGLTKAGEWKIFNANTVYTAETNGWIKVQVNDGMYCSVIIDGVELTAFYFDNEGGYALLPFYRSITPVFAGQTYEVTDCMAPMFAPCV